MLFDAWQARSLSFRNRIVVSPMCQYSAIDGVPQPWHFVHLGARAVGGAGLVIAEATAVSAEGRISPADTGIWNDAQVAAFAPIARFIREQGAVAGIQLAHAGRKASTKIPWEGSGAVAPEAGGWVPVAPSAVRFADDYPEPRALALSELPSVVQAFEAAAVRALEAEFQVLEIHAAHGYLLHEFLSPLSNQRDDAYGGSFENRIRLVTEVVRAVREVVPERLPVFLRISATDWAEGGWDIEQSVELARVVAPLGVDLVDVSSGGLVSWARPHVHAGYQVPFAARIRAEARVATGAVGLITEPAHAEQILQEGAADLVFIARALLRDPHWPLAAARALGEPITGPKQYLRAWT